jgi:predicted DNA-binding transcriptional regulator AlpA
MTDQLLRVSDVARMMAVAESTVFSWRAAGVSPESFKLRGVVVYRESVVTAWIDERETAANPAPVEIQSITRRTHDRSVPPPG